MKARMGAPKAMTATTHRLARIIYHMLTTQQEYDATVSNSTSSKGDFRIYTTTRPSTRTRLPTRSHQSCSFRRARGSPLCCIRAPLKKQMKLTSTSSLTFNPWHASFVLLAFLKGAYSRICICWQYIQSKVRLIGHKRMFFAPNQKATF
jgi:hypothetical protein